MRIKDSDSHAHTHIYMYMNVLLIHGCSSAPPVDQLEQRFTFFMREVRAAAETGAAAVVKPMREEMSYCFMRGVSIRKLAMYGTMGAHVT